MSAMLMTFLVFIFISISSANIACDVADALEEDCGTSLVQKVLTRQSLVVSGHPVRVDLGEDEFTDSGEASKPTASSQLSLSQSSEDALEQWYPTGIQGTGENAVISLTLFSNREHSQLLKPDTHTIAREGSNTRQVPIMEFIGSEEKVTTPIFLSFKVARCGSTLLDSMLSKDDRYLLVAEPQVLNQVRSAIPGDGSEDQLLRKKLYRALVFHLAKFITADQKVSFIDLNSQTSFVMQELSRAVPEAHSFLLWRNPIEVADSLYNKPPGWLRRQSQGLKDSTNASLLLAIEQHLEHVVGPPNAQLFEKTSDFPVFWYQHVLNGILPRYVVEKSFGKSSADNTEIKEMTDAAQLNSKTGKPWPAGKIDHNELNVDTSLKQMGVVWYNENLINFSVQHGPVAAQQRVLGSIKELRWPEDREQIKAYFTGEKRHEPVVVRNALASTALATTEPDEIYRMIRGDFISSNTSVSLLEAEKENYFVWHNKRKAERTSDYHVISQWKHAGWEDFENDPRVQIIDGLQHLRTSDLREKLHAPGSILDLTPQESNPQVSMHGHGLSLRVSHAGAQTALHYDCGSSLLWQLSGTKEFLLWPSSEIDNLYPYPRDHFMFRRMLADPEYVDPTNLPNFRMDTAVRAHAGPGDLVVWPARWAHHIRTVDGPSVSVGKRWGWNADDNVAPPTSPSQELISKVEALRYAKGFAVNADGDGGYHPSLLQIPDDHDDSA